MEIKKNEVKVNEKIKLRILVIGDETLPSSVRIELTSEEDIFFFYLSEINVVSFRKL